MLTAAATLTCACVAAWFVFKPLAFRLLPQEFAGPDGWYYDTRARKGIFDWPGKA
ncbi:hypothetical protein AIOL_003718 [Candidatus Rhodobacter oscarellae]|uniref:Uncharacterized protein n=1 Tax=Candidatus Rhodobacter oscarellae TaxID=1675527 RepID=A0A0J9EAP9_9RHOB|nr:hypothetical protein [Candidatus Rhodobacter lobularis]KMW58739.1 hypothetical protein AIOL_003718 [Candidatus Rhodobacter lobularis]